MTSTLSFIDQSLLVLLILACLFSVFVALLLWLGSVLNDEKDGEI